MTENNCLRFINISEKYELLDAVEKGNKFIPDTFEAFSVTPEFNEISKERLCKYISDDKLRLPSGEIAVFRAVVKWIENNSMEGEIDVAEIFKFVRFPFIPADMLLDDVLHHSVIEQNEKCNGMVKEALRFHYHVFTQLLQSGPQYKPRGEQKLVLITGGKRQTGCMYNVQDSETKLHFLKLSKDVPLAEDALKTFSM